MKKLFLLGLLTLNSSVVLAYEITYSNPITNYQVPAEVCTCMCHTTNEQGARVDGELSASKKEKSRGTKAVAIAGTVLGVAVGAVAIICIAAVIAGSTILFGLMWICLGGLR